MEVIYAKERSEEMIVKRMIDVDELESAASDMCRHYCRYPLIWDEQAMNHELSESEICRGCPMSELLKGIVVDEYALGLNERLENDKLRFR